MPAPGTHLDGEEADRLLSERAPWSGDAGAERLLALVSRACRGGGDFPTRLEAALRAALDMLAEEPELARLLTAEPYLEGFEGDFEALRGWMGRFGRLLHDAAAADPRTRTVEGFLAPFLIGGVRLLIARLVLRGEASELPRLRPGILRALLACYFGPGEGLALARATLEGNSGDA